jgi:tetrahydromethanopterin S-methyltransferase subunit G
VSNQSVTDDIILKGFTSLKEAMEHGFDSVDGKIDALRSEMNQRFGDLEHRMMRRFDEVGGRLDNHEHRITTLETQR